MYIFDGIGRKADLNKERAQINDDSIFQEIEMAKREWEYALRRFNDVSEPEVVDYIVYYIIAAERRYMYLLNKMKKWEKAGYKEHLSKKSMDE